MVNWDDFAHEVADWFDEEESEPLSEEVASSPVDISLKYAASQLRVVRETKDYQLDYLEHALRPGRELIDISPAYQRRLRWSNKKKSLLIESFLLNIPVPPIFLFERDYNEYEVIDGRQRLDAISSFLANEYSLTGLEYWPEINRQRFRDLEPVLRKGLLRRSLPAIVLLAETSGQGTDGIDVRTVLFDRLNTGGVKLNPQELRNALYPGGFNALLIELARSKPFTDTWGIPAYREGEEDNPSPDLLKNSLFSQMADAELVLRFFAIRDAILLDRKGSLRVILDRYMKENVRASEEQLGSMRALYLSCLSRLRLIYSDKTFHLPSTDRASRPLYDALMIALSNNAALDLERNASFIRKATTEALAENATYEVLTGRGNTMTAIQERVALAVRILSAGA
jgi:Protein of unknown function DUF262